MQTKTNAAIVINLKELVEKDLFSFGKKSSTNMSLATDKKQTKNDLDDLSLALTDIPEFADDDKSLTLEQLNEDDEQSTAADSSAFSESANSSANFSFTNETCANADSYPALYAPEKQQEYEQMKVAEERKEKYGMFHHIAGLIEVIYSGGKKVYCSMSSYAKSVDIDKMCSA